MRIPDRLLDDWGRQVTGAAVTAAGKTDSLVYLVGGPVRDLARGVTTGDLDLAVERNEDAFASALAELLSADISSTERFLTWRLTTGTARHVDLARVRTETYPYPGALPVVRAAATIQEDLGRRDFTVNAMAIRLNDGLLIDPFNGHGDLEAGLLRIIHERSFRDDPTRVFRALRLASRCGLAIEPATSTRLDEAVADRALGTVSRERVFREIDAAANEKAPVPVFRAFLERGCLTPFFGPVGAHGLARLPDDLEIPVSIDSTVVLIGAICRGGEIDMLDTLPYERSAVSKITAIAGRAPCLADLLGASDSPQFQFEACQDASREERFLAAAESSGVVEIVRRFDGALEVARLIRGDKLGVPPGPWVGRALRETARAVFAREVEEIEAAAFARRLAMKYLND